MLYKFHFTQTTFSYKTKAIILSIILINISYFQAFAQSNSVFSITFPTNRIIFQRNNDNIGFVNIIGNYTQDIDKVEAKLTPIIAGQGIETNWSIIQEAPKAGYFAGKIEGKGGWYKLEIRVTKDNIVLQTSIIEKVGIGEVFIALGQSNAQGILNYGAKGAIDDRVNTIDFQNTEVLDPLPENLSFVQLSEKVNIAPQGDGPWCYGELGDRLVKRLNVPVAFFNEGLLLVSVINWRESAEKKPTFNFVLDVGGRFQLPKGLPYVNLQNTLNYYGALMGVRSLLWIQGETDNSPNKLSADTYLTNLQRVIDISRNDFDENLTWMVARTSVTYQSPSNPEIISGQNRVINKIGNNVFAGPFTDNLQIPRIDNVHFQNVPGNMGISLLAENWDKALDDNFFKKSTPVLAKSIIKPEIICDANNQVNIILPKGFKSYEWSNNEKNNQITVDKGIFSVAVKDLKGNKLLVPKINTSLIYPSQKPIITGDKSFEFCTDGSTKIELTANISGIKSYIWSSGESTQKITVGNSAEFTVKGKNGFGCISEISEKVLVKPNPVPIQPKITVSPTNNICEAIGQKIIISTDSNDKLLWNNTATSKTITFDKIGNYEVSVKASNIFGCTSVSNIEKISINPNPKQPILSQIGLFTLKVSNGDFINSDQFEWRQNNVVLSKTISQTLKTSQNGSYQVSTIRTYTTPNNQNISCPSKPSAVVIFQATNGIISIYPNPTSDLIYLDTKETIQNLAVNFYTIAGKQVFRFQLDDTAERKEIDVRSLEKGTYIIRIKGDDFEESARLIIQK